MFKISLKNHAESLYLSRFFLNIESVGAMPAPAFTTIAPFEQILGRKNLVPFFRKIIIARFQG